MTNFDQIFPPDFLNAGYMSMAENDIVGRVEKMCNDIINTWGTILPSAKIIDDALDAAHLEWWILPQESRDLIDNTFDIIEG